MKKLLQSKLEQIRTEAKELSTYIEHYGSSSKHEASKIVQESQYNSIYWNLFFKKLTEKERNEYFSYKIKEFHGN